MLVAVSIECDHAQQINPVWSLIVSSADESHLGGAYR
jgi:hypothetical protein